MTAYRNPTTGEFRLVDETDPIAVAAAEAAGYAVYVQPEGSLLPPPYAPGLRLFDFQIANKNNPYK